MPQSDDPLVGRLGSPECRPLLDRLRRRLERGEPLTGSLRLNRLSDSERQRIKELTASGSRGAAVTVDIDAFHSVVRNTGRFRSLQEVVELALGRPVVNRRADKEQLAAQWRAFWLHAEARIVDDQDFNAAGSVFNPQVLQKCLRDLKRGWLRRITRRDPLLAEKLLGESFALLKRLPQEPQPLAIFAAEQTGDAHSLDSSQPLGRLMIKWIASAHSMERAGVRWPVWRRRIWESVGIVTDELSTSVLVLNLPVSTALPDATLTDTVLQQHAAAGMPCRITFRHLRLQPPSFDRTDQRLELFVCENPSVIAAAADYLGVRCPPMVCVEGQPNLTCWSVLRRLHHSGYRINYHGDFDWGGLRIANQIFEAFTFQPWRFAAADHKVVSNQHRPLKPPESDAIWDPELANAIRESEVAVEEESVIDLLLSDLSRYADAI